MPLPQDLWENTPLICLLNFFVNNNRVLLDLIESVKVMKGVKGSYLGQVRRNNPTKEPFETNIDLNHYKKKEAV